MDNIDHANQVASSYERYMSTDTMAQDDRRLAEITAFSSCLSSIDELMALGSFNQREFEQVQEVLAGVLLRSRSRVAFIRPPGIADLQIGAANTASSNVRAVESLGAVVTTILDPENDIVDNADIIWSQNR